MEKSYCVYVHTNKTNGKRYIGITSQKPEYRWRNGKGYPSNPHFTAAIEKYGWDGFEHEIIAKNRSIEKASGIERMLIYEWKTTDPLYGYNIAEGGAGELSVSETTRLKMSSRTSNYYKEHPEAREAKMRAVNQYDLNGNFIKRWNSGKEAADELGLYRSAISRACGNKEGVKTQGGFLWRYADEDDETILPFVNKHEKSVIQMTIDGNVIKIWSRIADAADALCLDRSSISKSCRGKIKTVGGYMWRYNNAL